MLKIPRANVSPGAFSNSLDCPFCNINPLHKKKSRWKFVENVTPFRLRYQCKDCKRTIQYDISNNRNFVHPYSPFKKALWQRIVERWKMKNPQK